MPPPNESVAKAQEDGVKPGRVLVGVCSCRKNAAQRYAIRRTWAKTIPGQVRVEFFVGAGPQPCEAGVWELACEDSYEALPSKVQAFMAWALGEPEWDFLFKCDDDTYVALERLQTLLTGADFMGSADTAGSGFASGGGGYLISRRCAQIIAEADAAPAGAEDVWVSGQLRQAGIRLEPSRWLQMDHRVLPGPQNDLVTAHWCSPETMEVIQMGMADRVAYQVEHSFAARHAAWNGTIQLLKGGMFLGGAAAPDGRWEFAENGAVLRLRWFHWPEDQLWRTSSGYENANLRLSASSLEFGNGAVPLAAAEPIRSDPQKLHLGAGPNRLLGWCNHDLDMDLRQPLPRADASVRFIFAEHVVEHITPAEAWRFFKEARRVLKPGGALRIALPCVDSISSRHDEAYRHFLRSAVGGEGTREDAVGSIISNWGHQAVWTVGGLRAVLEALGFQTSEAACSVSSFPELNGIDGHACVIGEHANWVETGIVEAVKPAR